MATGFFDNIVRWDFERNNTRRELPYFYYDNTSIAGVYTASTSKIKELLPDADMEPVEIFPGRGLVAIAAFEYRKTTVDPYNEVSISFLICYGKRQIPGISVSRMLLSREISSYVWQLPVNTEHARAGGVDLFGYPKILADIHFEKTDNWIACTLSEDGQEILQLSGRRLPTKPGKAKRYVTYAVENGCTLVATVSVNPIEYGEAFGGSSIELKLKPGHPISDTLRQLDLSKSAIVYQFSPVNEAILYPARNIKG